MFMSKSMVLMLILSIFALTVFSWSMEEMTKYRLKGIDSLEAEKAVSTTKNVYETVFLEKNSELKALMTSMDEEGVQDYKRMMEDVRLPDFGSATVSSPSFNPDLYYVSVPESNACVCQFTLRKVDGELLLESICRKNK